MYVYILSHLHPRPRSQHWEDHFQWLVCYQVWLLDEEEYCHHCLSRNKAHHPVDEPVATKSGREKNSKRVKWREYHWEQAHTLSNFCNLQKDAIIIWSGQCTCTYICTCLDSLGWSIHIALPWPTPKHWDRVTLFIRGRYPCPCITFMPG